MLVEKFDFIELLRLAIAQGKAEGKKISKDVVLGELALYHQLQSFGPQYWLRRLILNVLQ